MPSSLSTFCRTVTGHVRHARAARAAMLVALCLAAAAVSPSAPRASAATLTVDPADCAAPPAYCSIADALAAAADGDTIEVAAGTYHLTAKIELTGTGVTLRSASGAAATVLDFGGGNCPRVGGRGVTLTGASNTFEGFTVQGCNDPARSDYAVVVSGASNRVASNILVGGGATQDALGGNNADAGVLVQGTSASGNTIQDNESSGWNQCGICIGGSLPAALDTTVSGNTTRDNRYGISVDRSPNTAVTDNVVTDNRDVGIDFRSRDANLSTGSATGNRLSDNPIGIRIREDGGAEIGTVTLARNNLATNTTALAVIGDGAANVTATDNWWGSSDGPTDGQITGLTVADVTPFLTATVIATTPASVPNTTTTATVTVTPENATGLTVVTTGHTALAVGANTITVTATLTVAGSAVDTFQLTLTVTRVAAPSPTPTPAPPAEPAPTPAPTPTPAPAPTPPPSAPQAGGVVVNVVNRAVATVSTTEPTSIVSSGTGGRAAVTVPPAALPPDTTVDVAAIEDLPGLVTQAPPPATVDVVVGFVVNATAADGSAVTGGFAAPVSLEFTVAADAVPVDAPAEELVAAYWNGSEWVEVLTAVTRNPDGTYTLTATTDHFTVFVVLRTPGRGSLDRPVDSAGVNAAVWRGGTVEQLLSRAPGARSLWTFRGGVPLRYVVDAPGFVNADFEQAFPNRLLASGTIVLVVSG